MLAAAVLSSQAAAVSVSLTNQSFQDFVGTSSQTNNYVFSDGLGNDVTIALTLASSSGGSFTSIDTNTGITSSTSRGFVWDNRDLDENALFTATVVSSSANVDASSIGFRIDALGLRFTDDITANELDWDSDGLAAGTVPIIASSGQQNMLALDDQFHDIDASQYDATILMNPSATSDSIKYQMRTNHLTTNAALGMNLSAQFTVVPEPSSTALLGLGGLALILRRRR